MRRDFVEAHGAATDPRVQRLRGVGPASLAANTAVGPAPPLRAERSGRVGARRRRLRDRAKEPRGARGLARADPGEPEWRGCRSLHAGKWVGAPARARV